MSKATQSEAEPGVALEINGQDVQAREGQTILEAARDAGIEIPTLCEHEPLTNVGGCRMCLVEIDGKRTETACTTTVQDGMEIEVDSEDLWDHRRTILELMFSEQNHYCMYCEMEGDCELEDLFNEAGLDACEYPLEYNDIDVDTSHSEITLDLDRCVLCGRCVRTCDEVVGNDTLTFKDRGLETEIVADDGVALGESSCISCGACAQACPTGAIYTNQSAYRGREEECDVVTTTCTECSLGCELEVYTNSGRIVKVEGVEDGADAGQLCEMGRFGLLGDSRERIDEPSIRGDSVDVETAIERARESLEDADAINAVASSRLPTEVTEAFAASMDAYDASLEVPGAKRATDERRIAEKVAPLFNEHAGNLRASGPEAVLDAEAIAVFDTSIVDTHPVAASYVRRAAKDGATLVSVDADEDRFASKSDASIESGSALSRLTEDSVEVVEDDASALADSDTETLINAVPALEDGGISIIVLGPEIEEEDTLINAYALAAMTDSKVLSLPDRVNSFVDGIGADDLHDDAEVAYLFAADDREDDLDRMVDVARSADTVIVQATRESILTKAADIVLPSLDWFERSGTVTDASGTDRELTRVLDPRVTIDSDREVLSELAEGVDTKEVTL